MRKIVSVFVALVVGLTALIVVTDIQSAAAAGAKVQSEVCYDYSGSGSTSCTFQNFTGSGHLMVVYAAWKDTSTASADDNQSSGGLTSAASAGSWGSGSGYRQKVWYYPNTPNNIVTANIDFSGTPSWAQVIIAEFSGVLTSSPLGDVDHQTGTTGSCSPFNNHPCFAQPSHTKTRSSDLAVSFDSADGYVGGTSGSIGTLGVADNGSVGSYDGSTTNPYSYSLQAGFVTGVPYGTYIVTFKI